MAWLNLFRRKYRSFTRLPSIARWRLVQAGLLLSLVTVLLKISNLRRTQGMVARFCSRAEPFCSDAERHAAILQTNQMVLVAAQYLSPWAHCLERSLTLWGLLRYQGIDSDLRIGVQAGSQTFEAHAWVEYAGVPLNERADVRERYATFETAIELHR